MIPSAKPKAFDEVATVIENIKVASDVYKMSVTAAKIAADAAPGQFMQVKIDGDGLILRRPFGIASVDGENITFFYRLVGRGTQELTKYRAGDTINILGALGYGFDLTDGKVLIVGGGLGLAPLLSLAKYFTAKNNPAAVLIGGRTAGELFWESYFKDCAAKIFLTTDDGTKGKKGFAVSYLPEILAAGNYDRVAVCGPEIMMKKAFAICAEHGVKCEVSLERRMACGLGACLSCNIDTKHGRKHVCQDGPVFDGEDVF